MPSTIPAAAIEKITAARGAMASATLLIETIQARLEAAKAEALANGATEAQLAPVQAEIDLLDTETTKLATATAANP